LSLFDDATKRKYFAKKYGIELIEEVQTQTPQATPISQVNEHLKKLSGRDWQHIKRMIREVQNGKTNRGVGAMMLKNGYGLTDEDINVLLSTDQSQFSKFDIEQKDDIADLFEKFAIDDNDDEVMEEFSFHNQSEKLRNEKFIAETDAKILDMIKGDPGISPEAIAKQLQIDVQDVINIIAGLVTAGLIISQSGVLSVTEKGLTKEIEPVETEVYTVYKYAEIEGVPDTKGGSRPFCRKLLAMSRAGKRWTREGIDNIVATAKQQLAMPDFDPWAYRGGFYTNPNTNETTPWCRHRWVGVTKVRRKGAKNG
jgi:predicted transcriptional regulator